MAGKPIISGTRIPVDLIIKKLAQKMDVDGILHDYPKLTKADIQAALWYATEVLTQEEIFPIHA